MKRAFFSLISVLLAGGWLVAEGIKIEQVGNIPIGQIPRGMAILSDGSKIYLAAGPRIYIIDTVTNSVKKYYEFEPGDQVFLPVVSPTDKWVAAQVRPNKIVVLDTSTDQIYLEIVVPVVPSNIAFSPTGSDLVYVLSSPWGNTISIIDLFSLSIKAVFDAPVTLLYNGFVITPDGKRALITYANWYHVYNTGMNWLRVIDLEQMQTIADIPVGLIPLDVAITPDAKKAYVANYISKSIAVVDLDSLTTIKTLPASGNAFRIRSDIYGKYMYVLCKDSSVLHVIRTADDTMVKTLQIDGFVVRKSDIGFRFDGVNAIITATSSGAVHLLDVNETNLTFATIMDSFYTAKRVTDIVFKKQSPYFYVAEETTNSILIFELKFPTPSFISLVQNMAQWIDVVSYLPGITQEQISELRKAMRSLDAGIAQSGALQALQQGELIKAWKKIIQAIDHLKKADGNNLDTNYYQKMLALWAMIETYNLLAANNAPSNAWAIYYTGVNEYNKGNYKKAVEKFKKALQEIFG